MLKKIISFTLLSAFILVVMGKNVAKVSEKKDTDSKKKLKHLVELTKKKREISPEKNLQIGQKLILIGEKENNLKIKVLGLQTMGFGYSCRGKLKKAFEAYEKSLHFAESIDFTSGQAITYSEMSNLYYYGNNFPKALKYYKNAVISYRKSNNLYGEAKFQCKTANTLIRLGEYKMATKLLIVALKNLEKIGKPTLWERFFVIDNIANVTCTMGNLDIASKYIDMYKIMYKKNPNHRCKVRLLFLQSKLLYNKLHYKESLLLINKAFALQEKQSKIVSLITDYRVKMSLIEHTLEILLKLKKTIEIERLLKQMDTMFDKNPDPYLIAKVLLIRSKYYYLTHNIKLALKTAFDSERMSEKYNFKGILLNTYSLLSEWYIELNKPKLGLKYLKAKKALEKKNIYSRLPADIMSIILGYEQNKIKKEVGKLKSKNIKAIIWFISFIFIIIILFIFIYTKIKRENLKKFKKLRKEYEDSFKKQQQRINDFNNKKDKKIISPDKGKIILKKIAEIINKDKLFLNAEFNLEKLSNILNINHYYLSEIINSFWGNNFHDLINTYRVNEAKKILENPKYNDTNIINIGYNVGFNSISTFNRVFKSKVNITPKQYRKTFQKVANKKL